MYLVTYGGICESSVIERKSFLRSRVFEEKVRLKRLQGFDFCFCINIPLIMYDWLIAVINSGLEVVHAPIFAHSS